MFKHIKEMRKERGLTQKQISEAIGCSVQKYRRYEKAANVPIKVIVALAEYYDVSTDYLFGLTDIRNRFE